MSSCPECGRPGNSVTRETLEALLRPQSRGRIGDDAYCVCTAPHCETVYFSTGRGPLFRKTDLTVRFGLKETDAPRPLCYCFDHTTEAIEDEVRRTGRSTVVERIKTEIQESGCRCQATNPLGRCCLQTVQAAVARAFAAVGTSSHTPEAADSAGVADCCSPVGRAATADANKTGHPDDGVSSDPPSHESLDCCATSARATTHHPASHGALAASGSILAALLSSACCWLPLILVLFGVSAVGVAGFFEAYRPYFLVAAGLLLGLGYYRAYFRDRRCDGGSACTAPGRRLQAFNRLMLAAATVLVAAFALFPNYVGYVIGRPVRASEPTKLTAARLAVTTFDVKGMTCAGCAVILRDAFARLPGVKAAEVDYETATAVVRFDPDRPVPPERVVEAARSAGYTASIRK